MKYSLTKAQRKTATGTPAIGRTAKGKKGNLEMSIFLGLDSSTQSLKGVVIDSNSGSILASNSVSFGKDLPDFNSPEGVLPNRDPLVKHSNPLMWLSALDMLLSKLSSSGAPMGAVRGISGSGQQHGSVYLSEQAKNIFSSLDPRIGLAEQIAPALSRSSSPIWMDSSTSMECAEISSAVGGERLQQSTGSPAIERFTGPQIRKFYKESPESYAQTAKIHLVSSFLASVLSGRYDAPIDYGDGAGMNLLNLKTMKWDAEICSASAPELMSKLPQAVPSSTKTGTLCSYFSKYGLKPGIPVVAWSGDNPCSLVGSGAATQGFAVVSLGTSDTFFAAMQDFKVDPNGYGHVFGNPAGGFMSLICFKNGSLAREKIKEQYGVDWEFFGTTAFEKTIPGNDGDMMLPFFVPEITPHVLDPKPFYSGSRAFCTGKSSPEKMIRAIVEAQSLGMKLNSRWIGEKFKTIRVTGGASRAHGHCQVLADVFDAEVQKISVPDSAALGAAMMAANAVDGIPFEKLASKFCKETESIRPITKNVETYRHMADKFEIFLSESVHFKTSGNLC